MALSDEACQWMTENGLEGLLRIADAPPHAKPEQAATTIDLSEVTEGQCRRSQESKSEDSE